MTADILPQRKKLARPVAVAASAVGLIAATGLAMTLATHSTPPRAQASSADQVVAGPSECHVDCPSQQQPASSGGKGKSKGKGHKGGGNRQSG